MTGDGDAGAWAAAPVALVATRIRVEERMLLDAFQRRAVPCHHVDDRSLVYRVGGPPPPWRAVVNRALSASRRLEVSRWCEAVGTPVLNTPDTLARCDNKIATALALHQAGIPVPHTVVALDPAAGGDAAEEIGFPAVVKPTTGSWGRGVARIGDRDAAEAVFELRGQLASPTQRLGLLQEFRYGRDLRVLVVGGSAVAAITRESGHWVRNTGRGARARAYALDAELASLAERAAAAVGGGVLGVDLLETDTGERLVLEVNGAVEFHGLSAAHTDAPIAETIADHVLSGAPG
ncbi:[lysine-biosynthesis-protein LysW]--L-2-aminoadipate ligase [Haloactinospora alba]|uniref:[lysine-biosynthesis-protein LysW]--L-2-aminoadipate ligase n=1 Tax=Haloactinospora alba TaxID=405555 RepID=A0A543N980_9ACTN|nr:RimK family alpha-L-glutamate ligase [Haloactinospora alba]TQN28368.1 [lysine-biosynthesis-protein LysW]--L-2-aminoadipate ligase [Haloactinospora alba]